MPFWSRLKTGVLATTSNIKNISGAAVGAVGLAAKGNIFSQAAVIPLQGALKGVELTFGAAETVEKFIFPGVEIKHIEGDQFVKQSGVGQAAEQFLFGTVKPPTLGGIEAEAEELAIEGKDEIEKAILAEIEKRVAGGN